jgi:hypothetical protein
MWIVGGIRNVGYMMVRFIAHSCWADRAYSTPEGENWQPHYFQGMFPKQH